MFYAQATNGAALLSLTLAGLLAPSWTTTTLNSILNLIPYLSTFPKGGMQSDYGKMALLSTGYIGTMYVGLCSSKEFARYSIISRLYVYPIFASLAIPLFGVPNTVLAFAFLDIPCALWCQHELTRVGDEPDANLTPTPAPPTVRISRDRDFKMVLVVNTDLKMKKGKIAAQTAHAACGVLDEPGARSDPITMAWQRYGCAKVALKATQEQMQRAAQLADAAGIRNYTVHDAGRTQIAAGSQTVCAIGPMDVHIIDKITGREGAMPLKLL
jgi:PTH2 family peptidyl-tRNA hydrolase